MGSVGQEWHLEIMVLCCRGGEWLCQNVACVSPSELRHFVEVFDFFLGIPLLSFCSYSQHFAHFLLKGSTSLSGFTLFLYMTR